MDKNLLMVFAKHYQMMRSAWHFGCQQDFHHSFDSRTSEQVQGGSWALTYLSSWMGFASQQVPIVVWVLVCSPQWSGHPFGKIIVSFPINLGHPPTVCLSNEFWATFLYFSKFSPGQSLPLVPFNRPWTFPTCWSRSNTFYIFALVPVQWILNMSNPVCLFFSPVNSQPVVFVLSIQDIPNPVNQSWTFPTLWVFPKILHI